MAKSTPKLKSSRYEAKKDYVNVNSCLTRFNRLLIP